MLLALAASFVLGLWIPYFSMCINSTQRVVLIGSLRKRLKLTDVAFTSLDGVQNSLIAIHLPTGRCTKVWEGRDANELHHISRLLTGELRKDALTKTATT